MKYLYNEDFSDFDLNEFPYDLNHSALGEYHYMEYEGYKGNFYDPICLHQWRSQGGSWIITSDGDKNYLEQNRGDYGTGHFTNTYPCLIFKEVLYSDYTLFFSIRPFDLKNHIGMAFNYLTSRNYNAIFIKNNKIEIIKRDQNDIIRLDFVNYEFSDLNTYSFKVEIASNIVVYINDEVILKSDVKRIKGKCGVVAKGASRYSDIKVGFSDLNYEEHFKLKLTEETRLLNKRKEYSELEVIHKIDLKNFGSGRQLRIAKKPNGETFFIIAQHQKRIVRDSFASISCLTAFDLVGNIMWQIGKPSKNIDNSLISADLPFQVFKMDKTDKLYLIYALDFYVIIADALTGKTIKKMPTPIVSDDPLVENHPFNRLNVDAIRVADFSKLGYQSDFIIKDRYHNVWAYNFNFELLFRYNHKNTGHFPYIYDFNNDGYDEMFVGYDMVDHKGNIIFSLPMNSDHTDEIIYIKTSINEEAKLYLASGNEGFNIVNLDGSIYKHNEIGHAQRISIAPFKKHSEELQIVVSSFWGADAIIYMFDENGNKLYEMEQMSNGNLLTPVSYDGDNFLFLTNSSIDGGLMDYNLDKVVLFPNDNHPTLASEVYDIDGDGIDEIICFNQNEMWIYKAKNYKTGLKLLKYSDNAFSNYRGEYIIKK